MYVIQHAYRDGRLGICKHKVVALAQRAACLYREAPFTRHPEGRGFVEAASKRLLPFGLVVDRWLRPKYSTRYTEIWVCRRKSACLWRRFGEPEKLKPHIVFSQNTGRVYLCSAKTHGTHTSDLWPSQFVHR